MAGRKFVRKEDKPKPRVVTPSGKLDTSVGRPLPETIVIFACIVGVLCFLGFVIYRMIITSNSWWFAIKNPEAVKECQNTLNQLHEDANIKFNQILDLDIPIKESIEASSSAQIK